MIIGRGSGKGCEKKLNNSFSGVRFPADPPGLTEIFIMI